MKQFMPELVDASDRLMQMQQDAAKIEKTNYQKQLTADELAARREDLADDCIKLNQLEDDLKEIKDGFTTQMKPLKEANKIRLTEIKTKQTAVEGTLYHIANREDSMMETFDENGELVGSRRLRPEEKQGNVFAISKAV